MFMDEVIKPLLVVSDGNESGLGRVWPNPNTTSLNVGPTCPGRILH